MNKFDLFRKATLLADTESAYQLAKRVVELEAELEGMRRENSEMKYHLESLVKTVSL